MFGLTGYTADILTLVVMLAGSTMLIRDINRAAARHRKKIFQAGVRAG